MWKAKAPGSVHPDRTSSSAGAGRVAVAHVAVASGSGCSCRSETTTPSTRSGETVSRRTVSMKPAGSITSIPSPTLARSERARWRASPPSMTARSPSRRAKNAGTVLIHLPTCGEVGRRLRRPGGERRVGSRDLEETASHRFECFVDGYLASASQDWAALGHLGRLLERCRLDDAVAGSPLADSALGDRPARLDLADRPRKCMTAVDDRVTELLVPAGPLLQHPSLCARSLGHASSVVDEHVFDPGFVLHRLDIAMVAWSSPTIARAEARRSRLACSLSQRLWPKG